MLEWDAGLFTSSRYARVFERLRKKSASDPALLRSSPLYADLNLAWVLENEKPITKAILTALRSHRFEWDTYKLSQINQGPQKTRNIFITNWADRILQFVMAEIFTESTKPMLSNRVYSFLPGRGPLDALREVSAYLRHHAGSPIYALKRDITQYGESISHAKLLAMLEAESGLPPKSLYRSLLLAACRNPFFLNLRSQVSMSPLRGIPSGSPLVPPIENFYLHALDRDFEKKSGGCYVRYGDDFLYLHTDRAAALKAASDIDERVHSLELAIKPEKKLNLCLKKSYRRADAPDFFSPSVSVQLLGHRVSLQGQIGPKTEKFHELKAAFRLMAQNTVRNLKSSAFSIPERKILLAETLANFFRYSSASPIHELVHGSQNEEIAHEFDRFRTTTLVNLVRAQWGLNRTQSWRLTRDLQCPSLLHLYRQYHYNRRPLFTGEPDEDLRIIA